MIKFILAATFLFGLSMTLQARLSDPILTPPPPHYKLVLFSKSFPIGIEGYYDGYESKEFRWKSQIYYGFGAIGHNKSLTELLIYIIITFTILLSSIFYRIKKHFQQDLK